MTVYFFLKLLLKLLWQEQQRMDSLAFIIIPLSITTKNNWVQKYYAENPELSIIRNKILIIIIFS